MRSVTAFAPATVANLGVGFDCLGLAIREHGDTVRAELGGSGLEIVSITGDGGQLPTHPLKNTAGVAALHTLKLAGVSAKIRLHIHKGLPLGSGLGSSAASAAAAAVAVNTLLGSPLRKSELIGPCVHAEAVVSGRHADNVAPALLGGLLLIRSLDPIDVIRLPVPEGLTVVVLTPALSLPTREARAALSNTVSLEQMVQNSANLAALVSACYTNDLALFARSLPDNVATPARLPLIPGGQSVINAALHSGAVGSAISGAGPSIFALCRSTHSADRVAQAMSRAFSKAGQHSQIRISPADSPGARVVQPSESS